MEKTTNQTVCSSTLLSSFPAAPLLALLLTLLFASAPAEASSTPDGLELAQAVYNRPDGEDLSSRVVMILTKKGREPRQRLFYSYAKEKSDFERWSLLRFIKPDDVDKTGLLTKDYEGNESDQWLYLPALDRVRRIASSRKGGRFVGSDFYYEDLRDREVSMDHHRIIGKDNIGGVDCVLLESIPVERSNSVYSKRISCIHTKLLLPLQIDFYKKQAKEPMKRLRARKIKKVQGYWTIFESTMENLKTGHTTKLITTDILYDQNIPDELFSQRGLSDDSRETAYRPPARTRE